MPNVILTPHIGGSSQEAQEDIGRCVAGKLRAHVVDGTTSLSVNFPGIRVGELDSALRLTHVHHNVPGVLAEVNALFAAYGVNVDAQALATRGDLGYLVTDVDAESPPDILQRLERMTETIRLRVLAPTA